jgi:cation diffusion facilitator CzcD-associated flavoprotein CzcO
MADRIEVLAVGAGQVGLAVSHELTSEGVDHEGVVEDAAIVGRQIAARQARRL